MNKLFALKKPYETSMNHAYPFPLFWTLFKLFCPSRTFHIHRILLSAFLVLTTLQSTGQCEIRCENKGYAGETLTFKKITDPITSQSEDVFTLQFDASGKASFTVPSKKTEYVFSDFGIYQGRLFLEPGEKMIIKLPPLKEKSFAEEKNPYFSPVSFWLATDNKEDINMQIIEFTKEINAYTTKNFQKLYFRQSRACYEELVSITSPLPEEEVSAAYRQHRTLSLKKIESEALRLDAKALAPVFNNIEKDDWLTPAFIDLFNYTYSGQLGFLANGSSGKEIRKAIGLTDPGKLKNILSKELGLEGDIADLAALKMLYDEYFSGRFSITAIQKMVTTPFFSKHRNKIIRHATALIIGRFTYLKKGSPAPPICLDNLAGKKNCTDASKDKFKYIVFADLEMIVCREQLKYLPVIHAKYNKHLDIFVILKNTDQEKIDAFLKDYPLQAEVFIDKGGKNIDEYKIRSFPTSFLLDKQHRILTENTKSPLEGFEQQFGTFIQEYLFQELRNQSR